MPTFKIVDNLASVPCGESAREGGLITEESAKLDT
jgi:hypothetical protein